MFKIRFVKMSVVLVGLFLFSSLMSCSKSSDEVSEVNPDNTEAVNVEDNNFIESDEDLLKVDYKQFYEELSPHGEWIEVTGDEIGVDLNKTTASGEKEHRKITFSSLFGVNSAYADNADIGAFFVWKPAPELAVSIATPNTVPVPAPTYVPYSNGQWVNTEQGWYFQAPTPYEEIVHHYGRWTNSPTEGWVWVPGRVWSPAWVDWKQDDEYVAWSPLPPGSYIVNDQVINPHIYEDRYVVVEKRYFVEPELYKYHVVENKKKIIIQELRKVDGVMVVNHQVINKGPEVSVIESILGVPIPIVKINTVTTYSSIGYSDNVIHTYTPEFKKFKVVKNIKSPVRKPVKFVSFNKKEKNPKKQDKNESYDNKDAKQKGNDNIKYNERKFKHSGEGDMLDKRNDRDKKNDDNFKNEGKNKNDNDVKRNEKKNKEKNDNGIKNEKKSKGNSKK